MWRKASVASEKIRNTQIYDLLEGCRIFSGSQAVGGRLLSALHTVTSYRKIHGARIAELHPGIEKPPRLSRVKAAVSLIARLA